MTDLGRTVAWSTALWVSFGWASGAFAGNQPPPPPVKVVTPPPPAGAPGMERDDLPGPQPEIANHPAKLDTPAVPEFDLPGSEPGLHSPRELRVHGRSLAGSEIRVTGHVTWIYSCADTIAEANPKASRDEVESAIHDDPSLCERPMFALGDAQATPRELSITVIEPAHRAGAAGQIPQLAVGDYVAVTGTWMREATLADGDGSLTFAALERATPSAPRDPVAKDKTLELDLDGPPGTPMRKFVDDLTLNTSIEHLNACNKAIVAHKYETAINECHTATQIWDGNHLAWYAWTSVYLAQRDWRQAKATILHAVELRPEQPMYQLYEGIALYEATRGAASTAPAKISLTALGPAVDALRAAVRLSPELWRAHYYLGRAYRDLDEDRHAAVQFNQTIRMHPAYGPAYIALIELYRRWDYLDQALAVALLGTSQVAAPDSSELWFEAGVAYQAKRADDKALDAFNHAIAARPDAVNAKFQRGQLYLRRGDLASAQRDLEDVVRSADPKAAPIKPLATQIVDALNRPKRSRTGHPVFWECHSGLAMQMTCRPR